MQLSERQQTILAEVRQRGLVRVDDLARAYGVATQTIRRDLNALCVAGLARRVHGGARAVHSMAVTNLAYRERRDMHGPAKARIAAAAAALIPENCSVAINIGTTTERVAAALVGHRDLVVVTNNINIVTGLAGAPLRELVMVGGSVRTSDGAVIGEPAAEFIGRYKVDFAIIGCSAIDDDGAVLDYDAAEVAVARAMLRNARARILVADNSKFARTAPIRICDVSELDHVVTDACPPAAFADAAARAGVEVLVAETEQGTE